MRKVSRSFAILGLFSTLLLAASPDAKAAIFTYTFEPGTSTEFNDGTNAFETVTGAFTVDTTAQLVLSSSITLAGPSFSSGHYDNGGSSPFPGQIILVDDTDQFQVSFAFRAPFGASNYSLGPGAAV